MDRVEFRDFERRVTDNISGGVDFLVFSFYVGGSRRTDGSAEEIARQNAVEQSVYDALQGLLAGQALFGQNSISTSYNQHVGGLTYNANIDLRTVSRLVEHELRLIGMFAVLSYAHIKGGKVLERCIPGRMKVAYDSNLAEWVRQTECETCPK